MFPIEKQRFLPAVQQPGLNGLFGSFLRSLISAAVAMVQGLPIVGTPLANGVKKVIEGIAGQWVHFDFDGNLVRNRPILQTGPVIGDTPPSGTSEAGEPSAAEQTILTAWSANKLNPYYKALCTQLSNAFANPNATQQAEQINIVLFKIAAVRRYFANAEKSGLTAVGLETRADLIETIMQPVEAMIAESMAKNPGFQKQSVTIVVGTEHYAHLNPLMPFMLTGESIPCYKYVIPAGTSPAAVQTVVPVTTITTVGNDTGTSTNTTTGKKLFTGQNILIALGIAVAVKSLFFSKK